MTSTVAIVGAGSVGAFVGAHLSATTHQVVACVRRPFDFWKIESEIAAISGPAVSVTSPDSIPFDGPADWVLVGLKAHQSAGAQNWFDRLCGPDTRVLALQNGLEAVERLSPLCGGAAVCPSVVSVGTELLDPGHVVHKNTSLLVVPDDDLGHAAAALFGDVDGIEVVASPDYLRSAWLKLGGNCVANGLTALTGHDMSIFHQPAMAQVAGAMLTEVWTAGLADGADLDLDRVDRFVTRMAEMPGSRTSMLHDREAGRPTEHDAIHGCALRRGAAHGIPMPVTQTIHDLLAGMSAASQ